MSRCLVLSSQKLVATRTSRLNGVNTKTHNGEITNDKITSAEKRRLQTISKSDVAATLQDSFAFVDVFEEFRLQAVAIPL